MQKRTEHKVKKSTNFKQRNNVTLTPTALLILTQLGINIILSSTQQYLQKYDCQSSSKSTKSRFERLQYLIALYGQTLASDLNAKTH